MVLATLENDSSPSVKFLFAFGKMRLYFIYFFFSPIFSENLFFHPWQTTSSNLKHLSIFAEGKLSFRRRRPSFSSKTNYHFPIFNRDLLFLIHRKIRFHFFSSRLPDNFLYFFGGCFFHLFD